MSIGFSLIFFVSLSSLLVILHKSYSCCKAEPLNWEIVEDVLRDSEMLWTGPLLLLPSSNVFFPVFLYVSLHFSLKVHVVSLTQFFSITIIESNSNINLLKMVKAVLIWAMSMLLQANNYFRVILNIVSIFEEHIKQKAFLVCWFSNNSGISNSCYKVSLVAQ